MKLGEIGTLVRSDGPFLTAYLEVGRAAAVAAHELEVRWRTAANDLRSQGAPDDLLERVGERITEPTRQPGGVGRIVAAAGTDIMLDSTVAGSPSAEVACWGPLPDVTSWVADRDPYFSVLLVLADRVGADFEWYDAWPGPAARTSSVDGEDLHLTDVPAGDWAHKEFQRRTEEVWRRNARKVADAVDLDCRGVDVVALTGDVRACAEIRDVLAGAARERLVELRSGSRAPGSSRDGLDAALRSALRERFIAEKLKQVREFQERTGRGEAVALGIDQVMDSLVRGQAGQVLLAPESAAGRTVRPGRHPGLPLPPVALKTDELRADLAVVGAAAATDAEVAIAPAGALPDDGVAALLRWD